MKKLKRLKPGERISAESWNEMCDLIERAANFNVSNGLQMIDGPAGRMLAVDQAEDRSIYVCQPQTSTGSPRIAASSDPGLIYFSDSLGTLQNEWVAKVWYVDADAKWHAVGALGGSELRVINATQYEVHPYNLYECQKRGDFYWITRGFQHRPYWSGGISCAVPVGTSFTLNGGIDVTQENGKVFEIVSDGTANTRLKCKVPRPYAGIPSYTGTRMRVSISIWATGLTNFYSLELVGVNHEATGGTTTMTLAKDAMSLTPSSGSITVSKTINLKCTFMIGMVQDDYLTFHLSGTSGSGSPSPIVSGHLFVEPLV